MALGGAFSTGLTGLGTNSRNIDIIGDNIANVNTPSFKAKRAIFAAQFPQNFSLGSPPDGESGGTNPTQIGLGARLVGVETDFSNGGIENTGVNTHLALEGDGFFVLENSGVRTFTRDGQFQLNSDNQLVTASGARVQGYMADDNFNVVPGPLNNLSIPVGDMTIAEATSEITIEGNLNASGPVSTGGSVHETRTMFTDAALTPGNEATGAEDLTVGGNDLYISDGAGGSFLALEGGTDTVLTVSGVEKGGQVLPSKSFAFTDAATAATLGVDGFGSTMADYAAFLEDAFGLDSTSVGGQDLGGGVAFASGVLTITGNEGEAQALSMDTNDFLASNLGAGIPQPFVLSQTREADGETARSSFTVFDSLGTPINVDVTFVKQAVIPGGGTQWQFIAESSDTAAEDRVTGLGLLEFDANGEFVSATNTGFSIERDNGAASPQTIAMRFDAGGDAIASLSDQQSVVAAGAQDGSPIGTLESFSVGEDGVILGSFSNGLSRDIGQVALARFTNNEGLVALANNQYQAGANSGNPLIGPPAALGSGRVIAGALEQSNVDLSEEFVKMIGASTGFSASSRVITTADQMIQSLLTIGR